MNFGSQPTDMFREIETKLLQERFAFLTWVKSTERRISAFQLRRPLFENRVTRGRGLGGSPSISRRKGAALTACLFPSALPEAALQPFSSRHCLAGPMLRGLLFGFGRAVNLASESF
jgi:hypothetical protein